MSASNNHELGDQVSAALTAGITTDEALLAPFTHVCSLSSKGIRGAMIDAFNEWICLTPPLLEGVKECIDMLHNASLLIDDIEDSSEMRRGAPAAHTVFGVPLTLNCANQVYFLAFQKILSLPFLGASALSKTDSVPLSTFSASPIPSLSLPLTSPSSTPHSVSSVCTSSTDSPKDVVCDVSPLSQIIPTREIKAADLSRNDSTGTHTNAGTTPHIFRGSTSQPSTHQSNGGLGTNARAGGLEFLREAHDHYTANAGPITAALSVIFAEEMVTLHEGQGMDILWRDTYRCPTLEEYDVMVLKKTGGLFRLALRLMMALAVPSHVARSWGDAGCNAESAKPSASPRPKLSYISAPLEASMYRHIVLVETMGVFFQTLDDYLNVNSTAYHLNKSYCEDLTEGKFSYPIIHSILASASVAAKEKRIAVKEVSDLNLSGDMQTLVENLPLLALLKQRPKDVAVKRQCIALMEATGSLVATRERVEKLKQSVRSQLASVGGSPSLDKVLQRMCRLMETS